MIAVAKAPPQALRPVDRGGGGVARGERAEVPALEAALRGGRRGRPHRPQARPGVGQTGPERPRGRSRAALSRARPGFHGQAFPRASGEGPWLRLGLHRAQAASPMVGRRAESAAQGRAPEEARAAPVAGHLRHQDGSRHVEEGARRSAKTAGRPRQLASPTGR